MLQIFRYVKIGAFVNVMFRIQTNATSGGSGALVVDGLPFLWLMFHPFSHLDQ